MELQRLVQPLSSDHWRGTVNWDPGSLPINLREYESLAGSIIDPIAWDYFAGGADDEITLSENERAFRNWRILPRVLADVSHIDTKTTVCGTPVESPILAAPTALHGLAHPEGECETARGVAAAGSVFIASTSSSRNLEDIARACPGPRWFQLYFRWWDKSEELIQRAEKSGYTAIVLTLDVPVMGNRERDVRHKLYTHKLALGNFDPDIGEPTEGYIGNTLTWEVLPWIAKRTHLPIIVKGILRGDDAELALKHGAAAIIVSNHGGRQLDGAVTAFDALPEVVEAVASRCEVYVDGGIRRGTDIFKALALGAKAVLIGRPVIWGLSVNGAQGVAHIFGILNAELERAMALSGASKLTDINNTLLRHKW